MSNLQLIQVTPVQLEQLIKEVVKEQLEELKKFFSPKEPTELLGRNETAEMLKINVSTLHNWVKKGKLKSYGIEGRVYFKRSEIEQALVELK